MCIRDRVEKLARFMREERNHERYVQARSRGPCKRVPEAHERVEKRKIDERAERVDALDNRLVEAEDDASDDAERSGRAEYGEKRERASDGDTKRHFLGRDALRELTGRCV